MNKEILQSPNRPFRATPDARFFFAHESVEAARQTVVRAVLRAEGPALVLGGAGLGKSMLGEVVASELSSRFDIVRLYAARLCSRRALLQSILFELRLPYRNLSEGELRLSILDRLEPSPDTAPEGVLLLVDEAHTLPVKLLDELRLINNFNRNNQPRTRLVLIGNLRLEDTFTDPLMESFNQRLAARCYLQPMNRKDTYEYVHHQLRVAGTLSAKTITNDGLDAVYLASEGVPRLVNQLMDHAIVLAITNNQSPISAALIQEAWADLQQLPAPWHSNESRPTDYPAAVIEFGTLDEADDENVDEGCLLPGVESAETECQLAHSPAQQTFNDARQFASSSVVEDASDSLEIQHENANYFSAFSDPSKAQRTHTNDHNSYTQSNYRPTTGSLLGESLTDETARIGSDAVDLSIDVDQARAIEAQPGNIGGVTSANDGRYFANKPTDEELLAFEDEQAQYDAMGIWENDPPLLVADIAQASPSSLESVEAAHQVAAGLDTPPDTLLESQDESSTPPALASHSFNDLFGSDYEDEVQIPFSQSSTTAAAEYRDLQSKFDGCSASQPIQQAAVDVADYVARIQDFADAIARSSPDAPCVEEIIATADTYNAPQSAKDEAQLWEVSTASLDVQSEIAIARDIEDIVSQLNFSAFAVEPFSVEQIELESSGKPTVPTDSIRMGENAAIYMLHRAQGNESQSIFAGTSEVLDDDRDLLVIEEDLPISAKASDQLPAETAQTKTVPYSQLFAKLRK